MYTRSSAHEAFLFSAEAVASLYPKDERVARGVHCGHRECAPWTLIGASTTTGVADSFTSERFADGATVSLLPDARRAVLVSPDAFDKNPAN